jgi:hypothetical protein
MQLSLIGKVILIAVFGVPRRGKQVRVSQKMWELIPGEALWRFVLFFT